MFTPSIQVEANKKHKMRTYDQNTLKSMQEPQLRDAFSDAKKFAGKYEKSGYYRNTRSGTFLNLFCERAPYQKIQDEFLNEICTFVLQTANKSDEPDILHRTNIMGKAPAFRDISALASFCEQAPLERLTEENLKSLAEKTIEVAKGNDHHTVASNIPLEQFLKRAPLNKTDSETLENLSEAAVYHIEKIDEILQRFPWAQMSDDGLLKVQRTISKELLKDDRLNKHFRHIKYCRLLGEYELKRKANPKVPKGVNPDLNGFYQTFPLDRMPEETASAIFDQAYDLTQEALIINAGKKPDQKLPEEKALESLFGNPTIFSHPELVKKVKDHPDDSNLRGICLATLSGQALRSFPPEISDTILELALKDCLIENRSEYLSVIAEQAAGLDAAASSQTPPEKPFMTLARKAIENSSRQAFGVICPHMDKAELAPQEFMTLAQTVIARPDENALPMFEAICAHMDKTDLAPEEFMALAQAVIARPDENALPMFKAICPHIDKADLAPQEFMALAKAVIARSDENAPPMFEAICVDMDKAGLTRQAFMGLTEAVIDSQNPERHIMFNTISECRHRFGLRGEDLNKIALKLLAKVSDSDGNTVSHVKSLIMFFQKHPIENDGLFYRKVIERVAALPFNRLGLDEADTQSLKKIVNIAKGPNCFGIPLPCFTPPADRAPIGPLSTPATTPVRQAEPPFIIPQGPANTEAKPVLQTAEAARGQQKLMQKQLNAQSKSEDTERIVKLAPEEHQKALREAIDEYKNILTETYNLRGIASTDVIFTHNVESAFGAVTATVLQGVLQTVLPVAGETVGSAVGGGVRAIDHRFGTQKIRKLNALHKTTSATGKEPFGEDADANAEIIIHHVACCVGLKMAQKIFKSAGAGQAVDIKSKARQYAEQTVKGILNSKILSENTRNTLNIGDLTLHLIECALPKENTATFYNQYLKHARLQIAEVTDTGGYEHTVREGNMKEAALSVINDPEIRDNLSRSAAVSTPRAPQLPYTPPIIIRPHDRGKQLFGDEYQPGSASPALHPPADLFHGQSPSSQPAGSAPSRYMQMTDSFTPTNPFASGYHSRRGSSEFLGSSGPLTASAPPTPQGVRPAAPGRPPYPPHWGAPGTGRGSHGNMRF